MHRILSIFLLLIWLVACGQRGPLYLPPKPGAPLNKPKSPGDNPAVGQESEKPDFGGAILNTPLDRDATPSPALGTAY